MNNRHSPLNLLVLILFFILMLILLVNPILSNETTQNNQNKQYTIVVLTAKWCGACQYLKRSLDSDDILIILQTEYQDDLYFVDIEEKKNKQDVEAYLDFLDIKNNQVSLPTTFILCRLTSESPTGDVLAVKIGSMSEKILSDFLKNPVKYRKKQGGKK